MINSKRLRIKNISKEHLDQQITVWGWIRSSRFSKNVSFINVNDGSALSGLQLVIDNQKLVVNRGELLTGSCIKAEGSLVVSSGQQEFELQVAALTVVSAADEQYPLQKKRHTQEFLREIPHLRPRTNTHLAVGNVRNHLAWSIHDFFHQKGFKYIHAPTLTTSDCEGAGEMFRVTALNPKDLAASGQKFSWKNDLFGQEVFLSVSGQLEGEAMALAYGEIYTFAPIFRADPSDTIRHASEFWMVEPEMAFYDFEDLQALILEFIRSVSKSVLAGCPSEIAFFAKHIETELEARYESLLTHDCNTIAFHEAQALLRESGRNFEINPDPNKDLATEHERFLTDHYFKGPVLITNYPKSFKPFYMRLNDDNNTVACLDFLVPGVGELLTGSQREERYELLQQRMKASGVFNARYDWYLETRRWGSAPHSGFGIGFERLLMYLTGMKNIKDVLSFPRASGRIW